jgi:hypothetical protein
MIRAILLCVIAIGLDLTSLTPASAQSYEARYLKGLKSFHIIVETIPSNSCGVTEDDVRSSVQFVLTQSRIHIIQNAENWIYVNVGVLNNCSAADIYISVIVPVTLLQTKRFASGEIWRDGKLLGGVSDMQSRVMSAVEQVMKNLVVDWSSVNP